MRSALLALVLFGSACASDDADRRPPPVLRDAECPYDDDPGVRCAYLDVPAKRSDPASATLSLFVTVVEADRASSDRAPVVALAGGPGSTYSAFDWLEHPLRKHHDIVLIDQRGAGFSEPSLHCGELETFAVSFAGDSVDDPARRDAHRDAARACRDRYRERGVDLSAFNTEESAADVDDLRRALGVDQLNLYGHSYGTRLALEVMRAFPDSVRSATFLGTSPPPIDRFAGLVPNADAAIRAVFAACERDPDCPEPDMQAAFEALMAELDENPEEIVFGDGRTYYINAANVGARLFNLLYTSDEIVNVPHEALTYAAPMDSDAMALGVPNSATGLYLSINCGEEYPFTDRERAEEAPSYLRGYRWDLLAEAAQCEAWDVPAAPAGLDDAVRSDVPTLLMVGRFDPITPPHYTRLAAETLSRSQVIELPGAGHDTQSYTPCVQGMVLACVEDPNELVDSACVDDELGPPDF